MCLCVPDLCLRYRDQKTRLSTFTLCGEFLTSLEEALSQDVTIEPLAIMLVESGGGDSENTSAVFSNQWNAEGALNMKRIRTAQIHSQIRDDMKLLQSASLQHS